MHTNENSMLVGWNVNSHLILPMVLVKLIIKKLSTKLCQGMNSLGYEKKTNILFHETFSYHVIVHYLEHCKKKAENNKPSFCVYDG